MGFFDIFKRKDKKKKEKYKLGLHKTREGALSSLKEVHEDFLRRKAFDLLEIIPIAIAFFLIVFFPSNIFAVPIAFIMALMMKRQPLF